MKKSEMIEHTTAEILNAVKDRQYSNETDEKYYARKAEDILDMMLGFGMLPPKDETDKYGYTAETYHKWERE